MGHLLYQIGSGWVGGGKPCSEYFKWRNVSICYGPYGHTKHYQDSVCLAVTHLMAHSGIVHGFRDSRGIVT